MSSPDRDTPENSQPLSGSDANNLLDRAVEKTARGMAGLPWRGWNDITVGPEDLGRVDQLLSRSNPVVPTSALGNGVFPPTGNPDSMSIAERVVLGTERGLHAVGRAASGIVNRGRERVQAVITRFSKRS